MEKKMTEKEMFAMIMSFEEATEEVKAFCEKKIAALDRKAEKARETAAKKRAEGDALMAMVEEALTDEFATVGDITEKVMEAGAEEATVSKVVYRVNQLVKAGKAEKSEVSVEDGEGKKSKRMAYRMIVEA